MDILLEKITQQAMSYAIRSGITISASYAIREGARLLKNVKGSEHNDIAQLQKRLDSKIRIISPAIDMIELIAARGNTSLESAISLTKAIRLEIQALGTRLADAANDEEKIKRKSSKAKSRSQSDVELQHIIKDMKQLLERIEDAVPLINLAITTSGVNLSTTLPSTVSPSRLLQASTFLSAGDSQYAGAPGRVTQIGPAFVLSLYMLFAGHSLRPHDEESIRETTWKEVIHKARVKLLRVPLNKVDQLNSTVNQGSGCIRSDYDTDGGSDHRNIPSEGAAYEFAYQLLIMEDLDDERVHTFEDGEPQPGPFDDLPNAGIREIIPIHQISKIFYADTGKILNIGADGEANNPILLIKRDINALGPRHMEDDEIATDRPTEVDSTEDEFGEAEAQLRRESANAHALIKLPEQDPEDVSGGSRFPPGLDPEWVALEVYVEEESDSDGDGDLDSEQLAERISTQFSERRKSPSRLTESMSAMRIADDKGSSDTHLQPGPDRLGTTPSYQPNDYSFRGSFNMRTLPPIRTSLSLLELLIRLTALQQFQQASHLTITDELLNFFLSEASTTGAGADNSYRRRIRQDARRRVGFDPYDESPIKFHNEDYVRDHGQYDPNIYGEGPTPTSLRYPLSSSGSPASFRPSASAASESKPRGVQSSFGSPDPLSPSPSLNRLHNLRGPRGGSKRAQTSQSPVQNRLAPIGPDDNDAPGCIEQQVLNPTHEPLTNENHADSGLGTSPVDTAERGSVEVKKG